MALLVVFSLLATLYTFVKIPKLPSKKDGALQLQLCQIAGSVGVRGTKSLSGFEMKTPDKPT